MPKMWESLHYTQALYMTSCRPDDWVTIIISINLVVNVKQKLWMSVAMCFGH